MKKITLSSLLAALAALLALASPATAGTLTITSGPTFTPDTAFTNNTIQIDTIVVGGLVHILGGATITPDASNQVNNRHWRRLFRRHGRYILRRLQLHGRSEYHYPGHLHTFRHGNHPGHPGRFQHHGTLTPGLHKYEGTFQAPIPFPFATSGTFSGTLQLDFTSTNGPLAAAPGTLDLTIQQIDFQLTRRPPLCRLLRSS